MAAMPVTSQPIAMVVENTALLSQVTMLLRVMRLCLKIFVRNVFGKKPKKLAVGSHSGTILKLLGSYAHLQLMKIAQIVD